VKTLHCPDHFANRRGPGIAQKHGVLGAMAEGSGDLGIEPGRDVMDDVCAVIFIQNAQVLDRFVPLLSLDRDTKIILL
jgi:hypothetical protein